MQRKKTMRAVNTEVRFRLKLMRCQPERTADTAPRAKQDTTAQTISVQAKVVMRWMTGSSKGVRQASGR